MSNGRIFLIGFIFLILLQGVFSEEIVPFKDESFYNEYPSIQVETKSYDATPNLISAVQPIRVNEPYVTAGQPFIIEFTLENIGDELGYPFNQIALAPDSYALMLMADNQFDQVILPDGKTFDLWSKMSAMEKFGFVAGTSTKSFGEWASQQLEGRQCGHIDIWTIIPKHLQDEITIANGGKRPSALYNWSCIKLVDEPYFNNKVADLCQGKINAKCLAEINKKTYVGDSVTVFLTSTVPKGKCERVADRGILEHLGQQVLSRMDAVECGIGDGGLKPGEAVTFSFVGLVPADTPVLTPEDFSGLTEINDGMTYSASCVDSEYPENCHTIYAGVFPIAKDNMVRILTDVVVGNTVRTVNMIFQTLYNADLEAGKDVLFAGGGITSKVAGKPIWEGRGKYFVVGAGLKGTIDLIIMLAFFVSMTAGGLSRRTGR